jgi:hypothetical protein
MQAWKGWTAIAEAPTTWAEWCARQRGTLRDQQHRPHGGVPFTERELACLAGHAVPQQRSLHSQSTPSTTAAADGSRGSTCSDSISAVMVEAWSPTRRVQPGTLNMLGLRRGENGDEST